MNQGGEEAFDLPTVVGEEAASAVLPSRPPASIERLFERLAVDDDEENEEEEEDEEPFIMPAHGQDFSDWFDAVLPPDYDDSDDDEVALVPENSTLAGRPRLHRQILEVLKVYPDYRALSALIEANASLDIIKEALYFYDDIDENEVWHPLRYAFLCCPDETILYIAERFPNTVNWGYWAMFHNCRTRQLYDSEPVSMETWKELFSIIVQSGHPVRGIIEDAFSYDLSQPVLELLLEMTCPKIITGLLIRNGVCDHFIEECDYCFENGHLLGKLLPRIQRLTLENEMHFTDQGMVDFWSSLPSQGQLKWLDFQVYIEQVSNNLDLQTVLKNSLSNNRSIEHLSLRFMLAEEEHVNDFHKVFESIGDGVQNMPQLKSLKFAGHPVSINSEYVMEFVLQLVKGSTALVNAGVSGDTKNTAAISLWGQAQFYGVLNQVGRGRVRSMDQSNAEFLDLLLKSQRRDDYMVLFNALYGLLREKPSIWSPRPVNTKSAAKKPAALFFLELCDKIVATSC